MTAKAYDVVIIGAGIVGSACAAECAREGLSVAIVEAGIIGGGATATAPFTSRRAVARPNTER